LNATYNKHYDVIYHISASFKFGVGIVRMVQTCPNM